MEAFFMELTALTCKSCNAPILDSDIQWNLGLARCSHCGTVFNLKAGPAAGPTSYGQQAAPANYTWQRPAVPLPPGITVNNQGSGIEIDYSWFSWGILFLLFFAIVWNGFVLVWMAGVISMRAGPMALFGLFHLSIGIFLAYTSLAGLLNHTVIRVEMGELKIEIGPLPWPGNRVLQASEVVQFYTKEHITRNRRSVSVTYAVHAVMRTGNQIQLMGKLSTAEQALYIEQTLERTLGIQDQPVAGELPRW
jgi:predicted Zn finger-like uncharacterized protein